MDAKNNTASSSSLEKLYTELARKTAAAIAAEGPPSNNDNQSPIALTLPRLPRYQRPIPIISCLTEMVEIRMFFPGSGRMGFDKVKLSDELPPIEIVRQMIEYETRLRLCGPIQEIMDEYHTDGKAVT